MTLPQLLEKDTVTVAKELIGWRFYRLEKDGSYTGGTIIETEAYTQDDAASHSFRGKTPRTEIMFGPAGYLYVYFTYGMHWCANIVTGKTGSGEAVLLRAIQPDQGINLIRERRNHKPDSLLTDGPAKLCQALAINQKDNGSFLNATDLLLLEPTVQTQTKATPRIGITKDQHRLWRFITV